MLMGKKQKPGRHPNQLRLALDFHNGNLFLKARCRYNGVTTKVAVLHHSVTKGKSLNNHHMCRTEQTVEVQRVIERPKRRRESWKQRKLESMSDAKGPTEDTGTLGCLARTLTVFASDLLLFVSERKFLYVSASVLTHPSVLITAVLVHFGPIVRNAVHIERVKQLHIDAKRCMQNCDSHFTSH